ncbi:SH3 and multiple ankyrin repeat domains protein 2-like [Ptychodera flava]|uniref:SH3 and multiple ankyrin repeat domains protein 2-like n=1 Tax=Ptychodera flava TaxID=63121 RepID=UPI00396A61B8
MDVFNGGIIPPPPDHIPPPPPSEPPPPPPYKLTAVPLQANGQKSSEADGHSTTESPRESTDTVYVRVAVTEQNLQKCVCFHLDKTVWAAKQQVLTTLAKELHDGNNYGFYSPPENGKAGKFLEEERPLREYPLQGTIPFLEFKYKRRVYRQLKLDKAQIRKLHTKANLKKFMDVVKSQSLDKVNKMLEKGLDPNYHDENTGETPLTSAAVLHNGGRVVLALVNGGAHLDFRSADGLTPLHKAARTANFSVLKTFLDLGASPNYKDSKGLTPLYHAVSNTGSTDCIQILLHERSDINIADDQGWREIHQACRHGKVQHLEHLLYYGVDMNVQNTAGNTALHICALYNQESCARVLLFRGASKEIKNYANQLPFQVAIVACNFELAEMIRNHRNQNVVPFREEPKYSMRRRSLSSHLPVYRTWSETHLQHLSTNPNAATTGSLRSLPAFSAFTLPRSTSILTSSINRQDNLDKENVKSKYGAADNIMRHEKLYDCTPPRMYTAIQNYTAQEYGELTLRKGDHVQVLSISDHNYLEGRVDNVIGWFPSYCVKERKMEEKKITDKEKIGNQEKRGNQPTTQHCIRTLKLQKERGYGFVLRGTKTSNSQLSFQPSDNFPALQYVDSVEENGVAFKAGVKAGDFILEINGEDVKCSTHKDVVDLVRRSGDTLTLKVATLIPEQHYTSFNRNERNNSVETVRAPAPPLRSAGTRLSTASIGPDEIAALEELDNAIKRHSSVNDIASTSEGSVASIKARPTSKRLSQAEIHEMFVRQGVEGYDSTGTSTSNLQKPRILIPSGVKKGCLQRHPQQYLKSSLSTPNLATASQDVYTRKVNSPSGSVKSDSYYQRPQFNHPSLVHFTSNLHSEIESSNNYRRFTQLSESNNSSSPSSSSSSEPMFQYSDTSTNIDGKALTRKSNQQSSYGDSYQKQSDTSTSSQTEINKLPSSFKPDHTAKFNMLPPAVSQKGIRSKLKQHQRNRSGTEKSTNPMPARQSIHILPQPDYMDSDLIGHVNENKSVSSSRPKSCVIPMSSVTVVNNGGDKPVKDNAFSNTSLESQAVDKWNQNDQKKETNSMGVINKEREEVSPVLQIALAAKEKTLKQASKEELVESVDPTMALRIAIEKRRVEIENNQVNGESMDKKIEKYKRERSQGVPSQSNLKPRTDKNTINMTTQESLTSRQKYESAVTAKSRDVVTDSNKEKTAKVFIINTNTSTDRGKTGEELTRKTATQNARLKSNIQAKKSFSGNDDLKSVIAKRAADLESRRKTKAITEASNDLPLFVPPPPPAEHQTDVGLVDNIMEDSLPPPPIEFCADMDIDKTLHSDDTHLNVNLTEEEKSRINQLQLLNNATDITDGRSNFKDIINKYESAGKKGPPLKSSLKFTNGSLSENSVNAQSSTPLTMATSEIDVGTVLPPPVLFDDNDDKALIFGHKRERSFDNVSTVSSVSTLSTLSSLSARSTETYDIHTTIREDDEHTTESLNTGVSIKDTVAVPTAILHADSSGTSSNSTTNHKAGSHNDGQNRQILKSGSNVRTQGRQDYQMKAVDDWTVQDVGHWLDSIHMTDYKSTFEENEINGAHLSALTKDDYIELGVTRVGHRITIDRARKKLLEIL